MRGCFFPPPPRGAVPALDIPTHVASEIRLVADEAAVAASLSALDLALRSGGLRGDVDTAQHATVECTQLSHAVQTAERLTAKSAALSRTLVWARAVLDLRLAIAAGNWDRAAALVDSITTDSTGGTAVAPLSPSRVHALGHALQSHAGVRSVD